MADPKVLLKRSSVAGRVPTAGDLQYGELAINFADGKLYYKDNANNIKAFIDSARVEAIANSISAGTDSDAVIGIIDSAYVQSRVPLSYLDGLIDSAYVQARQDFSYSSLTGVPTPDLFDSNDAILLIDSAYVRARVRTDQDLYRTSDVTFANTVITGNLTVDGTTTTINSTTLSVNDKNIVLADSAADSAAANGAGITVEGANAKITYNSITDRWEFNKDIGSDVVGNLTGNVTGTVSDLSNHTTTDLAEGDNLYYTTARHDSDTLAQVDAAYVQARQTTYNTSDFTDSAFVTGLPVSTFTNDANYLDSNTVTGVIDQTYVRDNQITYNTSNFTDSAFVTGLPVSTFTNDANYLDSNTVTGVIDQTYVRDNQITYNTSNFTDSAYVTGLPVSTFTNDANYLDSTTVQGVIDATYVQANQITYNTSDFTDSAYVTGLPVSTFTNDTNYLDSTTVQGVIDATYIQANQTTYNTSDFTDSAYVTGLPVSTFTNDTNYLDSTTATQLIDSAYVQARVAAGTDSATVSAIIIEDVDAAYVQARQITYNTSDFTDSAFVTGLPVSTFTNDVKYLDSSTVTGVIDASYVQANQITYTIPTFGNDYVDSATVINIINSEGLDSDLVIALVDSAYIQLRDRFQDSSLVTSTVDASYVQARQITYNTSDFTDSAYVTGLPVSTFTNDANYLDSTTATQLIDSAYVQARQVNVDALLDEAGVTALVDSAYVQARQNNFLDSALTTQLIDSAYVQARQITYTNADFLDSNTIEGVVDSAYVRLRIPTDQELRTTSDVDFAAVDAPIVFTAKNASGSTLLAREVVYISGVSGEVPTVDRAHSDDAATMPAFGMVKEDANDNANVQVVTFGTLNSIQTDSFSAGDTLFISATPGKITNVKPAGEGNLLQNIGMVVRSHESSGVIRVGGAGRTNAVPNLDNDQFFLGNDSNYAVATDFSTAIADVVNSAYVQARQITYNTSDFTDSAYVTGLPVSTFTNDANYLDSNTVTGVIDQTYVRDNQITYNTSNFTDSAYVTGLPVSTFTNDVKYLDSSTVTGVINSGYIQPIARASLSGGTGVTYDNASGEISIDSNSTVIVNRVIADSGEIELLNFDENVYTDADVPNTLPTFAEGNLFYLQGPDALTYSNSNINVKIGQDEVVRVYNNTGSDIAKGKAVYVTGAANDFPTIALAKADAFSTVYTTIGLTSHAISNGTFGFVTVRGLFGGLNTIGFTAGDTVHVSFDSAGEFVATQPEYPNYPFEIGTVLVVDSASGGAVGGCIQVNPRSEVFEGVRVQGNGRVDGNLTIAGDLSILGSEFKTTVTNLNVGDNFIYIGAGDTLTANFVGTGLNDATFKDYYEGDSNLVYYVKVTATDSAGDTIQWGFDSANFVPLGFDSANGATTWDLGTDNTLIPLRYNIKVTFEATTGHTIGDYWYDSAAPTNQDLGIVGNYNLPDAPYSHAGFFRDASDQKFKIFNKYDPEVTGNINTSDPSFELGTMVAATFEGDLTGDVTGTVSDISNHTTTGLAEGTNLYYTSARHDSDTLAQVDAAYVQARQTTYNTSNFTDSAYVTGLPVSTFTNDANYLDSTTVQGVIDATYIQANQTTYNTSNFTDSAYVTGLPVSTFTNDANYLDSTTATQLIDSAYIQLRQADIYRDSGFVTGIVTASYIQTNQTTYNTSDFTDSAYVTGLPVSTFTNDANYLDSTTVQGVIDGTYIQANQTTYSNVSEFTNDANYLDSTTVQGVIDATYIQANQTTYNTSDFLDSSTVTLVVDSAYVQARQVNVDALLDEAEVTALVDSAYVQLRQDYAYSSLTGTPTIPTFGNDFVDSATVLDIINSEGLDSDLVIQLVDSAYIQLRDRFQDSSLVTSTVNDAYIQARQITYNTSDFTDSAFVTGLPVSTFTNDVKYLDSSTVTGVIDASYIQSNQTTYTNVSEFTNDANYLDSTTVQGVIDATYVQANQITYNTSNFTDSAFVTGLPVSTFTNDVQYLDSTTISPVFNTLFAAKSTTDLTEGNNLYYTKARVDSDIVTSLGDSVNTVTITVNNVIEDKVDSAYVLGRIAAAPFIDSADAFLLIDSDYIKTVQYLDNEKLEFGTGGDAEIYHDGTDLFIQNNTAVNTDTVITGDRVVLGNKGYTQTMASFNAGGVVSLLAYNSIKFQTQSAGARVLGHFSADSATFTNLTLNGQSVDSAWVQARSAASGAGGTDSATVSAIITADVDKAFVDALGINATQLNSQNASYYLDYDNFTNTPTIPTFGNDYVDSATVVAIIASETLDSALIVNLVDSAYIQLRDRFQDSSLVTSTVNDAYVQARQITYNTSDFTDSAFVTGLLAQYLDSNTATQLIDSAYIETRRPAEAIFNVVNNGASAYTFTGDGFSTGSDNPTLYLQRGLTYKFSVNASGHPFQIRVSDGGSAYNTGVTNNGAQTGDVLFTPDMSAPNTLVYQCTVHSSMVGNIIILDDAYILDSARVSSIITADVDATFINNLTIDADTLGGQAGSYYLNYNNFTNTPTILDSAEVIQLIDSAYVQARQSSGEITIQDEGTPLSTAATTLNFVGSAVTATGSGTTKTITISQAAGGTDSATVVTIIGETVDSAYVQLRQSSVGGGGLDSALTTQLIDEHLNQNNPTDGFVLSWTSGDYAWVAQSGGGGGGSVDSALTLQIFQEELAVTTIGDILGTDGNPGDVLVSDGDGTASWSGYGAYSFEFKVTYDGSGLVDSVQSLPTGWTVDSQGTSSITIGHNTGRSVKDISYNAYVGGNLKLYPKDSADALYSSVANRLNEFTAKVDNTTTGADASQYAWINIIF